MSLEEQLFDIERFYPRPPYKIGPDECSCSNCGWNGKVTDCEEGWESEGWEYPDYRVHYCPVCPDGGCVDDYWYSEHEWEMKEIVDIIERPFKP